MIRYEVKFFEKKWNEMCTTYCMTLENCMRYNPIHIRKIEIKNHEIIRVLEVIK